ncbi:MAG: HPr family phosphocarrier protein [Eubacterium sp.]
MREFRYVIKDAQGIHARPAGLFVKEAAACECSVTIAKDGREVDAKRILGVMGLGAKQGQEIVLKTEGADEDAAMDKLSAFLEENL